MTQKTLLQQRVLIVTDPMVKVPTTVYAHEIPIINELWGDDNVIPLPEFDKEVELDLDLDEEYDRLVRKYANHEKPVIQMVYGRTPAMLATELGVRYSASAGAQRARKQAESLEMVGDVDITPDKKPVKTEPAKVSAPEAESEAAPEGDKTE